MSQEKLELLDKYAYLYNNISEIDQLETSYRVRTLLEHTRGRHKKVLEMGIGFGIVTRVLAERFEEVVAVDGSAKVITRNRNLLGQMKNLTLIHSLFEKYNPESNFDLIIMFDVLEHVVDPMLILNLAKGWLAPKGKIHIVVPNAYSFHRRLGRTMGLLVNETDIGETDRKRGHYRIYTYDTIRHDIEKARLDVELIKGTLIKPLSTRQMAGWSPEILDGLYRLGMELPDFCSEIYVIAGIAEKIRNTNE